MLKLESEIIDILILCSKLLKFLQGAKCKKICQKMATKIFAFDLTQKSLQILCCHQGKSATLNPEKLLM